MADEKKISAKEAGIAVLKKFEELLVKAKQDGKPSLVKSEELKKDDAAPPAPAEGGSTINSQIGNPFGKHEDDGDGKFKGHIKLAKFIGHIQGKKSSKGSMNQDSGNNTPIQPIDKSQTGHEKGINTMSDPSQKSKVMLGTSKNGSQLPTKSHLDIAEAKEGHKQVLNEMKQMPKPKLPG